MLKVLHICLPLLFRVTPTRPTGHFHFDFKPSVDILGKQSAVRFLKLMHFMDVLNQVPPPPLLFSARGCTTYRSAPVLPLCGGTKEIFRAEVCQCLAPNGCDIMGR